MKTKKVAALPQALLGGAKEEASEATKNSNELGPKHYVSNLVYGPQERLLVDVCLGRGVRKIVSRPSGQRGAFGYGTVLRKKSL